MTKNTFADIHKSVVCQLFLPLMDTKIVFILISSKIEFRSHCVVIKEVSPLLRFVVLLF